MGKKKHDDNHDGAKEHGKKKRVKVEVVTPEDGQLAPFACYFPAGQAPTNVPLEAHQMIASGKGKTFTLVGRQVRCTRFCMTRTHLHMLNIGLHVHAVLHDTTRLWELPGMVLPPTYFSSFSSVVGCIV